MIVFQNLVILLICGIAVMLIHEIPKSVVAYLVTHPLYKNTTTINKNMLEYIDPVGLIIFMFYGMGWQKPYEYNPTKFRDKKKGMFAVAIAGIISNLLVMSALIPLVGFFQSPIINSLIVYMIRFNFSIVVVNLLPIPPLDMSKIIYCYSTNAYFKLVQNQRIIHTIFLLLLILNIVPAAVNSIFLTTIFRLL